MMQAGKVQNMRNRDKEKRSIAFSPPDISEQEIAEVIQALRSGWITTGPRVKELEKRLAKYCHTDRAVCFNSATAAEEMTLRILGVGPGDEVIVPAYTYTATAAAAIHCGASVVFVDSQKDGDCVTHAPEMDYDAMEAAITEKTKVVIAVDIAGIICDYERIYQAVENKRHVFQPEGAIQRAIGRAVVLSDGAHAFGAKRNGRAAGEIADFTTFSFHAVKNLTTAEGGAVTWRHIAGVDDDMLYEQYQLYSLHGQSKDALKKTQAGMWEYDIAGPWYKCNMTDIMAAIGLKQIERYGGLLERRRAIIEHYDALCDASGIMHLNHFGINYSSSGHLYFARISGVGPEERAEIIRKLAEQGIAVNVHYKPLPMMTAYMNIGWDIKDFPNAYDYYSNLITLPLHTLLLDADVDYVMKWLGRLIKRYR